MDKWCFQCLHLCCELQEYWKDKVHNAQNGEDGQVKYLQCSQLCSQFLQEYWKDDVHNAQNGKNRQVTLVMFMIIFKTGKMDRWNC